MKKIVNSALGLLLVFSFVLVQPLLADPVGSAGQSGVDVNNNGSGGSSVDSGVDSNTNPGGAQDAANAAANGPASAVEQDSGGFSLGSIFGGLIDAISAMAPGGFGIQGLSIAATGQSLGAMITGTPNAIGTAMVDAVGAVVNGIGSVFGGTSSGPVVEGSNLNGNNQEPLATNPFSLTLTTNKDRVTKGGSITLTWQAQGASGCIASGDNWSGSKQVNGSEQENNLQVNQVFTLTCVGPSNVTKRKTVFIEVAGSDISYETALNSGPGSATYNAGTPISQGGSSGSGAGTTQVAPVEGAPAVGLVSSARQVPYGTSVTLSWNSKNAIYCSAGNDWPSPQGAIGGAVYKPIQGSQTIPFMADDKVFTISCYNSIGDVQSSSVSVAVITPTTSTAQ
jgi:hypothetical protein